jgi:hypothetical protein
MDVILILVLSNLIYYLVVVKLKSSPYLTKYHSMKDHLCLGLSIFLFPSGFPPKILSEFLTCLMRATCLIHSIFLDLIT